MQNKSKYYLQMKNSYFFSSNFSYRFYQNEGVPQKQKYQYSLTQIDFPDGALIIAENSC